MSLSTVPRPRPAHAATSGSDSAPAGGGVLALRVTGLAKHYGELQAVRGLDLELRRGEVFGLLGPNGCGKSTTLGMLVGHLRPTAGSIEILGVPLAGERERERALARVGALVEAAAFYPYLTARENLRLLATARRVDEAAVRRALAVAGLEGRADDAFQTFSHGLKQRLGVAAALLHDPELVILDEPTDGLDPAGTLEIRALIPRIASEGRTVLLASHQLHEVEQVCDRVAIMQRGVVIAEGTVRELLAAGERVAVVVPAEDRERARELLAALPAVTGIEGDGDALIVAVTDGDAGRLNRRLAQAGIYASRLGPSSRSLESVFLELTAPREGEA